MWLSQGTAHGKRRGHKGTDRGANFDTPVTSFGVVPGRFMVPVAQIGTGQ